jgi:predicted SprT family Zn-dependent metalloprotease
MVKVGSRFGSLEVVAPLPSHPRFGRRWKVRCACGEVTDLLAKDLRDKRRAQNTACRSCRPGGWRGPDVTGQRFGRWTAVRRVANRFGRAAWLCRCDCGTEREQAATDLRAGKTKACRSCAGRRRGGS